MKNKYLIILPALILISCKKNFLDLKPESGLVESDFYRNTAEVETGVYACYDGLQQTIQEEYKLTELRSDMETPSNQEGEWGALENFTETATNDFVRLFWQLSYNTIGRCNLVLKYLDNVTDSAKKQQFEGEARFIRAHMYFNLVRLWGEVPLVTEQIGYNDAEQFKRKPVADIYALVIGDLQTAVSKLPAARPSAELGRITVATANAMLGKAYLTRKQYSEARPFIDAVAADPNYQLLPSYPDVFSLNNEMNREIIYAVRYKSGANGEGQAFTFDFSNRGTVKGIKVTADMMQLYTPEEAVRKAASVSGSGNNTFVGKYQDPTAADRDAGNDWIVERLPDVLLMQSEINARLYAGPWGAAMSDADSAGILGPVNRIRIRAGLTTTRKKTDAPSLNDYMALLMQERKTELAFENYRWYDLLRWGIAESVMNAHFAAIGRTGSSMKPHQAVLPIPQREIDVSQGAITQNQGY